MKRLRIAKWGPQFLVPRTRAPAVCALHSSHPLSAHNLRSQSTAAIREIQTDSSPWNPSLPLEKLPSPPPAFAPKSSKLAALHSRLSLPSRLPVQTLARALVDPTADNSSKFNNWQLSMLGSELLGYYTAEHLLCHYPRLPVSVFMAANWAYVGPKSLSLIAHEWGVEHAAEPGGEVDPGLLQLRFAPLETDAADASPGRWQEKRGMNWRILHNDRFGDMPQRRGHARMTDAEGRPVTTLEGARKNFVQAVVGAMYLHCGRVASHRFFASHVLSRQLDLASLFDFKTPTRDLSRLCAREGLEAPVARLVSETGRHSRHPVFVVAVYSGKNKLGEGAGASLDEARVRAASAALRSWYLYSPQDVTVPSSVEGVEDGMPWKPNYIDCGEVVV